jgi:hypothetical protein
MKLSKIFLHPIWLLVVFCILSYYPFFLQGKVPFPGDVLVGAYYPWLDYKWGYPAGVPVKNSLLSDSFSQFLPWKYMVIDQFKNGQFPLWNNYAYSGYPLLANYASSPFQPFNLLLLLPKYWGWGMYVFAQSLIAALGMYFFLSLFIKNAWAKIVGSFVFAFASLMTTWVEFGTGVYAAAMLPWIFSFVERFLRTQKWRFLFGVSLSTTILFLSGHAQLTTFSSILLIVYILYKKGFKNVFSKEAVLLGFFWTLAIVLALVQLLPVFSNTETSIRSAEAFSRSINFGLNAPYEMIRLMAADFFGHPATNNYWSPVFYAEQSSFLGTLTLPIILPLVLKRFRNSQINFWLVVFFFTIFMAIDTPITQWFYSLPLPLLTYSNASRIFFVSVFAVSILLAYGFELLQKLDYQKQVVRSLVYFIAGFMGIVLGIGIIFGYLRLESETVALATVIDNLKVTLKNLVLPIGLLVGGTMIVYGLRWFLGQRQRILLILLTLMFVFDLSRYFLKLNPFVPQQFVFPVTPVINFLQTQPGLYRVARADKEAMPPNTWMPYKLEFVEGYDPLVSEDYVRYFKVLDKQGYQSGIDRFSELNNYPSHFLDAMNVKYFVAVKRSEIDEIGKGEKLNYRLQETDYKKVYEDGATVVLENPHVMERAYFVETVKEFSDKQTLVNALQDKVFNPKSAALLVSGQTREASVSAGKVTIDSYQPQEVHLTADSQGKGFIVLSDSFDDGWKLKIDGKTAELLKVNGAVRGFWIDQGNHQIVMKYWPQSFDIGLKLSLFGFGIGLVLLLVSWRQKWF